jgi:hypothetical protein
METVFLICAIVGGTLIACQFLLTLIGMGGDHDASDHGGGDAVGHDAAHDQAGADHGSSWFFSMLTIRTVSAAAAFFGLTGLAAHHAELEEVPTIALAVGAGAGAFFVVGWLMRFMHRLNLDGTIQIERAVGCRGSVYLPIPAGRTGLGKVHVTVVNRMVEYQALTTSGALAAGTPIVIVSIVGPDTVEVAAATGVRQ